MEIWKDIVGYDGKYQASSFGNIRSLSHEVAFGNNKRLVKGRVLKFNKHRSGYLMAHIGKKRTVHRVVASLFVPNPNNFPEVNHIDGDKANNCSDNLEWVSRSENIMHAYNVLGRVKRRAHNKITDNEVDEIRMSKEPKMVICHRYNISRSTVGLIQKSSLQNI